MSSNNTVRASASPHFARRRDHPYFIGCLPERIYCKESGVFYERIGLTSIWVSTLRTQFTRAQDRAQRLADPVAPPVTAAACPLLSPLLSSHPRFSNKQTSNRLPKEV